MSAHETLGLLLVREGLITRPELYDALRLQRQNNRLLGTCLLTLGYVRPEDLLAMLAKQLAIPALPPGTLSRAHPEAVRRVPRDLALKLRILPYSWDGQMLGVALADGRVLNHLQEVAYHAHSAVGAYVALETEIEAVLRTVYPDPLSNSALVSSPPDLAGRPRPARASPPPLNAQELGPAVLAKRKTPPLPALPLPAPTPPPTVAAVIQSVPTAAKVPELVRMPFFDAIEKLYEAASAEDLGCLVGRALLEYFTRVLVVDKRGATLRAIGCAGLALRRIEVPESALPLVVRRFHERSILYGLTNLDPRHEEVAGVFGFVPGRAALLAAVGDENRRLMLVADNGDRPDLYEDLHDIELLFKEAETGLGMLLEKR